MVFYSLFEPKINLTVVDDSAAAADDIDYNHNACSQPSIHPMSQSVSQPVSQPLAQPSASNCTAHQIVGWSMSTVSWFSFLVSHFILWYNRDFDFEMDYEAIVEKQTLLTSSWIKTNATRAQTSIRRCRGSKKSWHSRSKCGMISEAVGNVMIRI